MSQGTGRPEGGQGTGPAELDGCTTAPGDSREGYAIQALINECRGCCDTVGKVCVSAAATGSPEKWSHATWWQGTMCTLRPCALHTLAPAALRQTMTSALYTWSAVLGSCASGYARYTRLLLNGTECCTGAKGGWKLAWETMMKELAPQDSSGAYARPDYDFGGKIGTGQFPVQSSRYDPISLGKALPGMLSSTQK